MMNVLFFGSIQHGLSSSDVSEIDLPELKRKYAADCVFLNGTGILDSGKTAGDIFIRILEAGVTAITLGGQSIARSASRMLLKEIPGIIRPLNLPPGTPGRNAAVIETVTGKLALVVLVTGTDRNPVDNPYTSLLSFLAENPDVRCIIADFSGPGIPLKKALAWKLRQNQLPVHILGSGLNVPTADLNIHNGRFFVSDTGTISFPDHIGSQTCAQWWSKYSQRIYDGSSSSISNGTLSADAISLLLDDDFYALKAERIKELKP